jgi:hypothetical protein
MACRPATVRPSSELRVILAETEDELFGLLDAAA